MVLLIGVLSFTTHPAEAVESVPECIEGAQVPGGSPVEL